MEKGVRFACRRSGIGFKFPLSLWEVDGASTVLLGFGLAISCVYPTAPASDYGFLTLPPSQRHRSSNPPVAKRRKSLLNYMLFLRVTPTLPNTFINVASPVVDIPYHTFVLATFIGLTSAAYVIVRAGIALSKLRSMGDLCDFQATAALFLVGIVSVTHPDTDDREKDIVAF